MPSPALFFQDVNSLWEAFPSLYPNCRQEKLCFTNGCFDLIHLGHVQYLEDARVLGDFLIVGLNSDQSVARIKGPSRPIQSQTARALVLLGLRSVDAVICFDEDTPEDIIKHIQPDVLIKGGDYTYDAVIGRDTVLARSGRVELIPFLDGYSTTSIVNRIKNS